MNAKRIRSARGASAVRRTIRNTRRLYQNARQFLKDRTFLIRPEIDLIAANRTPHNAGRGKQPQFALDRANTAAGDTNDLPQIKLFLRLSIQQPEHRAAIAAEEGRAQDVKWGDCIHYWINCTIIIVRTSNGLL